MKDLDTDKVTIEGQEIACRVQQVETTADGTKTTVKTWCSDTVAPYVLRRKSVATEAETDNPVSETKVQDRRSGHRIHRPLRKAPRSSPRALTHKHAKGHTVARIVGTL